ncbi:MAG: MerC domain-containing protein [Saprospiraceae bacterium]
MNLKTLTIPAARNNPSDLFGALASSLCVIHCVATPLIFVVQASAIRCSEIGPWWWRILDYLFLVVSIFAIYQSADKTSLAWMPKTMYIAWGVLAFLIINTTFHVLPIPHLLVYLPAFSLVFLHLYNRKYCRCATTKCCATT